MVLVLPKVKGFGEQFGEAIGGGFQKGAEFALKMGIKNRAQLAKNAARIRPEIKSYLSLYDKNKAFDSDMIANLENASHKYLEHGLAPHEAVHSAYNDILSSSNEPETVSEGKSGYQDAFSGNSELMKKLGIVSDEGVLSDIGKGLQKGGRTGVQLLDFPFQLAKKANYMGRGDFKTLTDLYDELTEGKGKPTNIVEEYAQGLPLGLGGVAAVHGGKTLEAAGLPESVQHAGEIITLLASHRLKVPAIKDILNKAKKTSEVTGKSTEQILSNAQKESGVSLEKITAGDEEAIRSFKDKITEAPKVGEKVSSAPKEFFNKKKAEKERAVFGAKLPESPLEEYYEIRASEAEKQASKRPETLQREREIREKLAPEEDRLYNELRSQKEAINRLEKERVRGFGEGKERMDVLYEHQIKKLGETTEALKDIQYEMKYGRPRPSEAEIDAQIEKSVKKFEEGIQNPTEKIGKDLSHQLELDKKYLDRAGKLIERGELPGEIRPDTFIKMKQKYLQGYKTAINKAKEEIQMLKGETDLASRKRIIENQELIKRLSDRLKRLEADVINQTDNIKAMRALEKPSGAFYKQQINSLKKDTALFKDELFKQKRLKSSPELKVQKLFKENAGEIQKGKDLIENPTKENIQEAAQNIGKKESELTQALKQVDQEVSQIKTKTQKGTVTPNTENKFFKKAKFFAKGLGVAYAVGATQAAIEEAFGIKLNAATLRSIASLLGFASAGTTTLGRNTTRAIFDRLQANELKQLRGNIPAWNRYIKNMENKHGKAKVRRVLKLVDEKEED